MRTDDYEEEAMTEREYYDMVEDAESDSYHDKCFEDSELYHDCLHKEFLRQNPWYKE